jgi:hypothetical protein
VAEPIVDHVELVADYVEPEADLAGKEGQEGKEGDNKEERDAEPSTVIPIDKEPPRSFVPKAP